MLCGATCPVSKTWQVPCLPSILEQHTMNSDSDHSLNRLVVAALTIFVTVSLLLAAFVVREIWLQQRIVDLSANLEDNIANLEETTEEIQSGLSETQATTNTVQQSAELAKVTELLSDASEQLDSIGEEINEVATILEPEPAAPTPTNPEDEVAPPVQDRADQVFTIFAMLVGIAGVAIAILLGRVVSMQ
jgi:hypothetical protein